MTLTPRHVFGVIVVSAALLGLASCGEVEPGSVINPAAAPVPPDAVRVVAFDNRFLPESVTVPVGSRVLLVNNGRNEHNIIPGRNGTGWGIDVEEYARGVSYEVAFNAPGTYHYFCDIHGDEFSGMIGQIVVE